MDLESDILANVLDYSRIFSSVILNSQEYQRLVKIIKLGNKNTNIFKTKKLKSIISYNEFKIVIKEFIILIMKTYLKGTIYERDNIDCIIKNNYLGYSYFKGKDNVIMLNEFNIKKLYNGDIFKLTIIFHELYHFIVKYDILLGKINYNLISCLKEKLLSSTIKYYYINNYYLLIEEKYADIRSIIEFQAFLVVSNINVSKNMLKKEKKLLKEYIDLYTNTKRYVGNYTIGKTIDFRDFFNDIIMYHSEWLNYPLLQLEYYLNNSYQVQRRTNQELNDLLQVELAKPNGNKEIINYLELLLQDKNYDVDKRLIR